MKHSEVAEIHKVSSAFVSLALGSILCCFDDAFGINRPIRRRSLRIKIKVRERRCLEVRLEPFGLSPEDLIPGLSPQLYEKYSFVLRWSRQELMPEKPLTNSQEHVLKSRYLTSGRVVKLEEIGDKLGVTRQRVNQIEEAALLKLGWLPY